MISSSLSKALTTIFLPAVVVCVAVGEEGGISRFAFGSCCKQNRPIPIFETVARYKPDVWIWMGDNIYADTKDMRTMESKYAVLASKERYGLVRKSSEVIGTWDDHDYGENDVGSEYPKKKASQQLFLDFLEVPKDSERRSREGVYASHTFGASGQHTKVILLDTRYHRQSPGPESDILGDDQWEWLESELKESNAQVHLLVSSIQLLPTEHRYEKWANFPKSRTRLLTLLSREDIPAVTVLSGDRHLAEISRSTSEVSYRLHEITSSSLNSPLGGAPKELNGRRLGKNYGETNFGTLEIDWRTSPPTLVFALRNANGVRVQSVKLQQKR